MMRVVIDTNILLASIGSGAKYRRIFDALVTGRCCALLTTEILLEYAEVIGARTRPVVAHNVLQALVNAPFSERITVY